MTALFLFRSPDGGDHDFAVLQRFHGRLSEDTFAGGLSDEAREFSRVGDISVPELIARLQAGDRDALTTLYEALFTSLWRVAVLQTRSADGAKDVVQDVFLWLWTHRRDLSRDTDIRVYLSAAVRNRARDLGKHAQVVERTATNASLAELPGIGHSVQPTDPAAESAEFVEAYQRALTLLNERELTAALLRWEEGFTLEQIAQVLSVSAMGARGIVLRAQRKVQDALRQFR